MERGEIATFDYAQVIAGLPGGFHFPARMTAVQLRPGELALISPIPIDDALARRIAELGQVSYLLAPNLHHHLYLAAASARYPGAAVLAPPGLASKRPELRISGTLDRELPPALRGALEVIRLEGAPAVDEFAFYHRATATLVVTDLVFNILQPRGFWAHLILWITGCHGQLAATRTWRLLVKDRPALARSLQRLLELPLRTLVMAHGEIVRDDAHARLREALRRWLPAPAALPLRA
ncbi:MAG TPA: hypothetical protein VFS67_10655 [Polyangiaceae bacterium]|nr:hypothetical protein [Polyangiaceae bacterium]